MQSSINWLVRSHLTEFGRSALLLPHRSPSMNLVQVSVGGRDVLVPVTTVGDLATGVGAVSNALQSCRSLESGES